jgi:hypothetical protein
MIMSTTESQNRLARHPGYQGARPSAGNQAGVAKSATGKSIKHQRNSSDNNLELENGLNTLDMEKNWPRYLLVNGTGLSGASPILIMESIIDKVGQTENTSCLHSGALLIKCRNKAQSDALLLVKKLDKIAVSVIPHPTLNSCKGVITSWKNQNSTDEQIKRWLMKNHGIKDFPVRSDGSQIIILTIPGHVLPKEGVTLG